MGVDEGVLITAREFGGSDTYATSQIIAAGIDTYGVDEDDVILAGVRPSMAIPLRSAPRSLRSCICLRSPMPVRSRRRATPSSSSVCWRMAT